LTVICVDMREKNCLKNIIIASYKTFSDPFKKKNEFSYSVHRFSPCEIYLIGASFISASELFQFRFMLAILEVDCVRNFL